MKIDFDFNLDHPKEKVLQVLQDFDSYDLWWPKKFRVAFLKTDSGENRLYLSPFTGITLVWTMRYANEELKTNYIIGPVIGNGIWFVDNVNEPSCKLHYNIDVAPKNLFWKLLLIPKLFRKTHLKHMEDLFSSLNAYLSK